MTVIVSSDTAAISAALNFKTSSAYDLFNHPDQPLALSFLTVEDPSISDRKRCKATEQAAENGLKNNV